MKHSLFIAIAIAFLAIFISSCQNDTDDTYAPTCPYEVTPPNYQKDFKTKFGIVRVETLIIEGISENDLNFINIDLYFYPYEKTACKIVKNSYGYYTTIKLGETYNFDYGAWGYYEDAVLSYNNGERYGGSFKLLRPTEATSDKKVYFYIALEDTLTKEICNISGSVHYK